MLEAHAWIESNVASKYMDLMKERPLWWHKCNRMKHVTIIQTTPKLIIPKTIVDPELPYFLTFLLQARFCNRKQNHDSQHELPYFFDSRFVDWSVDGSDNYKGSDQKGSDQGPDQKGSDQGPDQKGSDQGPDQKGSDQGPHQ